jgi:hypothetical protein
MLAAVAVRIPVVLLRLAQAVRAVAVLVALKIAMEQRGLPILAVVAAVGLHLAAMVETAVQVCLLFLIPAHNEAQAVQ